MRTVSWAGGVVACCYFYADRLLADSEEGLAVARLSQ